MRALTVQPLLKDSLEVTDLPDPVPGNGELLVTGLAIGVCGTDREIAEGQYGWAPPGQDRLVLGHESLGRVQTAPPDSGFAVGDLVAGVVRRPDPVPCGACAHDEFDMCRNGRYTERGIKEIHGFGSEQWTVESAYAVKLHPGLGEVGVLMEPTSVVAKAWEQVERIGSRAWFEPRRALVTGAGPIGLLAAMLGVQRGLDVHVLDRGTDGPKPVLVADLGATYHSEGVEAATKDLRPDVIIEATGVGQVVFDALISNSAYGIVCLTGVSPAGRRIPIDAGLVNREVVLENDVMVGSVNANLRTTPRRRKPSRRRTVRGWAGSSADGCRWRLSPRRSSRLRTMSRSSSRWAGSSARPAHPRQVSSLRRPVAAPGSPLRTPASAKPQA